MPLFRHRPLESEEHIRVVHLDSGESSEPLRCRVEHILASQNQTLHPDDRLIEYEAISYAWGDASDKELLDCTDGYVLVPRNLISALWQLRERKRGMIFWADSICLNQDDIPERNVQVARMGLIFSNAKRVIMWLGKMDGYTSGCLEALRQFCDLLRSNKDSEQYQRFRGLIEHCHEDGFGEKSRRTIQQHKNPDWQSLAGLFRRPYFSRLWIVQEVHLAREAIAMCGPQELNWSCTTGLNRDLEKLYVECYRILRLATSNYRGIRFDNWMRMNSYLTDRRELSSPAQLLRFLDISRYLLCSDPRDHIYGGLQMISGIDYSRDKELRPDYNLTKEQVFLQAAIWLLVKRQCINALHIAAAYPVLAENYANMPSWVSVYHASSGDFCGIMHLANFHQAHGHNIPFHLAGSSYDSYEQEIELSNDAQQLLVSGKIVTSIDGISSLAVDELVRANFGNDGSYTDPFSLFFGDDRESSEKYIDDFVATYLRASLSEIFPENWRIHLFSPDLELIVLLIANASNGTAGLSKDELITQAAGYIDFLESVYLNETWPSEDQLAERQKLSLSTFPYLMASTWIFQRFCRTSNGRLGLVTKLAARGDVIAILYNLKLPLVLRPQPDRSYRIIGHCILRDTTPGAALEMDDIPTQRIALS